jgi:lipopolysaccharide/colanic/teichoic acid biosynthesis glycosyltransferase
MNRIYHSWGKRLFDALLASLALILLLPLLLFIALAVRIKLGSPVLFRQMRGGLHQQPFEILKFRTMTDRRDATGKLLPDCDRMIGLGRFLRATSLDEVPELFNVLKGEMSLVGPRPLLTRYQPWYTTDESRRFTVLPGITGWAQVSGRNSLNWEERFRLDCGYVDNCSLLFDVKILLKTVAKVLRRDDVHVDTTFTVPSLDEERKGSFVQSVAKG